MNRRRFTTLCFSFSAAQRLFRRFPALRSTSRSTHRSAGDTFGNELQNFFDRWHLLTSKSGIKRTTGVKSSDFFQFQFGDFTCTAGGSIYGAVVDTDQLPIFLSVAHRTRIRAEVRGKLVKLAKRVFRRMKEQTTMRNNHVWARWFGCVRVRLNNEQSKHQQQRKFVCGHEKVSFLLCHCCGHCVS